MAQTKTRGLARHKSEAQRRALSELLRQQHGPFWDFRYSFYWLTLMRGRVLLRSLGFHEDSWRCVTARIAGQHLRFKVNKAEAARAGLLNPADRSLSKKQRGRLRLAWLAAKAVATADLARSLVDVSLMRIVDVKGMNSGFWLAGDKQAQLQRLGAAASLKSKRRKEQTRHEDVARPLIEKERTAYDSDIARAVKHELGCPCSERTIRDHVAKLRAKLATPR